MLRTTDGGTVLTADKAKITRAVYSAGKRLTGPVRLYEAASCSNCGNGET